MSTRSVIKYSVLVMLVGVFSLSCETAMDTFLGKNLSVENRRNHSVEVWIYEEVVAADDVLEWSFTVEADKTRYYKKASPDYRIDITARDLDWSTDWNDEDLAIKIPADSLPFVIE